MTNRYFPLISANELKLDRYLRLMLLKLPYRLALSSYSVYTLFHLKRQFVRFRLIGNITCVMTKSSRLFFPAPMPQMKWLHVSLDYKRWLCRKYTLPGFVEVEKGDVVIDCGAFVGGFSLGVASLAERIYIFEPGKLNNACARLNLIEYDNVTMVKAGLYSESKLIKFNISTSPVEHSILSPDDGVVEKVETIKVYALKEYCKTHGIVRIDFLKVEAEGVEKEIIEGSIGLDIRKLAIDCSPERNGMSPLDEIKLILEKNGYQTKVRGYNLYAKKLDVNG